MNKETNNFMDLVDQNLVKELLKAKENYEKRWDPKDLGNGLFVKYTKDETGNITAKVVKEEDLKSNG